MGSNLESKLWKKNFKTVTKELRALRSYFGPPMRPKIEIRFPPNSSYELSRTMVQVYKSDVSLTFTVAMVKKWPPK